LEQERFIYPGAYIGARLAASVEKRSHLSPGRAARKTRSWETGVIIHARDGAGSRRLRLYPPHEGPEPENPQVGKVVIEEDVEIGAKCRD